MKKKVCLIYTGGTIGMVNSDKGYIPSDVGFRELLASTPDLQKPTVPDLDVYQFDPLLDSCNIAVNEWNKMGKLISDLYDNYDGFIILHGTDTMAYSASALAFMMENLGKPIIFTGAQIPLCEVRSDGYSNIVTAAIIAGSGLVNEVCIYFNGQLIRGCRATKQSSDQLGAFSSPNCAHLADAGITIQYNKDILRQKPDKPFHFQPFKDIPVGVIKIFPGIQFELFESIMTEKLKGVVLESFGAGNIPSSSSGALLPIIDKAYRSGSVIVVCSQCVQGTVSLGTYETSKALHDIGAITGSDMTTEAALTKLLYLFSKGKNIDEIKQLMSESIRGELTV